MLNAWLFHLNPFIELQYHYLGEQVPLLLAMIQMSWCMAIAIPEPHGLLYPSLHVDYQAFQSVDMTRPDMSINSS